MLYYLNMDFSTKIKKMIETTEMVVTAKDNTSVSEIIKLLQDNSIGSVVIVDQENKPIGIFTERDILTKVIGNEIDLDNTPIEKYMTTQPKSLKEDQDILRVATLMRIGRFRHVVIVNDSGVLTGVISSRDILNQLVDSYNYSKDK